MRTSIMPYWTCTLPLVDLPGSEDVAPHGLAARLDRQRAGAGFERHVDDREVVGAVVLQLGIAVAAQVDLAAVAVRGGPCTRVQAGAVEFLGPQQLADDGVGDAGRGLCSGRQQQGGADCLESFPIRVAFLVLVIHFDSSFNSEEKKTRQDGAPRSANFLCWSRMILSRL
jgi:hypothetical protein